MTYPTAEDLYARHARGLFGYLARMTRRRDVADDLIQDVFLRVVKALRTAAPISNERAWLYAIARNALADRYHDDRRSSTALPDGPNDAMARPMQPLALGLSEALDRMAPADRECLLLREWGGLTYEEIAATTGCTIESVRARLRRARTSLREELTR